MSDTNPPPRMNIVVKITAIFAAAILFLVPLVTTPFISCNDTPMARPIGRYICLYLRGDMRNNS